MHTEFHKELTEKAPKLMAAFCELYGYTYYEGYYYNNYLLDATKMKIAKCYPKKIDRLKERFDVNLENFKLDVMPIIGHLQANGYHFNFITVFKNNDVEILIGVYQLNNNKINELAVPMHEEFCYLNPAIEFACLVACEHLEKSL